MAGGLFLAAILFGFLLAMLFGLRLLLLLLLGHRPGLFLRQAKPDLRHLDEGVPPLFARD